MKSKPGHVNIFNLIHSGIVKRKINQYSICQNTAKHKTEKPKCWLKKASSALFLFCVSENAQRISMWSSFFCLTAMPINIINTSHQKWKMTTCTFLYGLAFSVLLLWNETFGFCPTFYVTSQPDYHRRLHSLRCGQSITGWKLVATFPVN